MHSHQVVKFKVQGRLSIFMVQNNLDSFVVQGKIDICHILHRGYPYELRYICDKEGRELDFVVPFE